MGKDRRVVSILKEVSLPSQLAALPISTFSSNYVQLMHQSFYNSNGSFLIIKVQNGKS